MTTALIIIGIFIIALGLGVLSNKQEQRSLFTVVLLWLNIFVGIGLVVWGICV